MKRKNIKETKTKAGAFTVAILFFTITIVLTVNATYLGYHFNALAWNQNGREISIPPDVTQGATLLGDVQKNTYSLVGHEKTIQDAGPVLTNGPMNSSWPMYCHDVRHTGRSPYSTADNFGVEKWQFPLDRYHYGSIAIADDGTVYTGGRYLYAITPDGTLKWKYDTRGVIASCPAIDQNGTIYVGTTQSNQSFYAMYPNGTVKWTYPVSNDIYSSPAIGNDGAIYIGAGNNIYCLYPNGTQKWVFLTSNEVYSSPAIDSAGTIYCQSNDSNLYALYPNNGSVKWVFHAFENIEFWMESGSPAVANDGTIYFGTLKGTIYAVSPNGTLKWKTSGYPSFTTTPAIASDGTIYIGNYNGYDSANLSALYPTNGSVKWNFNISKMIFWVDDLTDLAVSAEGTIFFGVHYAYNLYPEMIAMNPNGTIKWRASITGDLSSAPAIAQDGTIYLGTIAYSPDMMSVVGYLRAFGPGKMKKIEIIQPKPGHFYLFGRDLGVTKHGSTIVIGDIDIKLKMDNEQNITNVTYYLNRNCMYTATQPPFDWTMNKRYYQCLIYNGLRAYVLAVAQFQGGCLWAYQASGFWYIHFLNN